MSEEFEAPPIGGENIPFKELHQEKPLPVVPLVKKNKNLSVLWILLIVVGICLGIFVGMNFRPKTKTTLVPSPSPLAPSPSLLPSVSPRYEDINTKIENHQKTLDSFDLKDSEFYPPSLDYKIRFKTPT